MKSILIVIFISFLINFQVKSQFALVVAKNENGSSVKYCLKQGTNFENASLKAKKELEELFYKDIQALKSTEETGHDLQKGFYVLVISSRKDYKGKLFVSYGFGASASTKQEATARAIIHLKEFDWGYDEKYGYAIEKEGLIEKFDQPEEK